MKIRHFQAFFTEKLLKLLAYLLWKIFKKPLGWIQSYDHVSFLSPKRPTCPKVKFFRKNINMIFMYLVAPFIVENFKKSLERILISEDSSFLGPKWAIDPNKNFFLRK